MTEFTDGEPVLDFSLPRPTAAAPGTTPLDQPLDSLTREFDISALPWITAEDEPPEGELPELPPPQRRLPPPSSKRGTEPAIRSVVGGAAASPDAAPAPRRLITVPKASPSLQHGPLPLVMLPHTDKAVGHRRYLGETLPPRERSAEASAEHSAARGPWFGRTRPMRPLIAVSILAIGGLTVTAGLGLVRRRGSDRIDVHSTPAFLGPAIAVAADPTPPPSAGANELAGRPPADSQLPALSVDPAPAPSAPPDVPLAAASENAGVAAGSAEAKPKSEPVASEPPLGASDAKPTAGKGLRSKADSAPAQKVTPPRAAVDDRVPTSSEASTARPSASVVDPITTYTFAADELFSIAAAPKRMTDLILQPGEKLVTRPTAGDASLWVIHVVDGVQRDQQQQHVQVTPLRADTSTNLTLTTTRRNYHLELTSSKAGPYMAAVQWRYPADDTERRREELTRLKRERESTAQVADVKALRFGYSIQATSGAPTWKPTTVFDDGAQTFIRFPSPVPPDRAPLLFVLRAGGTKNAQYVNYRVRGDLYVIERLIDTVELRLPASDDEHEIVRITRSSK